MAQLYTARAADLFLGKSSGTVEGGIKEFGIDMILGGSTDRK